MTDPTEAFHAIIQSSRGRYVEYAITPTQDEIGLDVEFDLPIDFPLYPLSTTLPRKIRDERVFQTTHADLIPLVEKIWSGQDMKARLFQGRYNGTPAVMVETWMDGVNGRDVSELLFRIVAYTDARGGFDISPVTEYKPMLGTVPTETTLTLTNRSLHWFLRQYSSSFTEFRPFYFVDYLSDRYVEKETYYIKLWGDYYDILVLRAKLHYKRESADEEQKLIALMAPGHALVAMKKQSEAVQYLIQLSNWYEVGPMVDTVSSKVVSTSEAAISLKNMEKWTEAERYQLLSLHHYGQHLTMKANVEGSQVTTLFDPNQPAMKRVWIALRNLYWDWPDSMSTGNGTKGSSQSLSKEINIMLTFVGLLVQAGWTEANYDGFFSSVSIDVFGLPRRFLKRKYRKQVSAKEVILCSLQADNPSDFRSSVLAVKQQDATMKIPPRRTTNRELPAYRQVRDVIRNNTRRNKVMYPPCAVCKRVPESIKTCPCRTVFYCSRECQIQHWKQGHKESCPNAKKK